MDAQTLGAAIAICGKQIEEKMENIAGEIDGIILSVDEHKLVFSEKEGE